MNNIIFIEGVSGVGKTSTVCLLSERLRNLGFSVKCHIEGDPYSPLDLCWTSYLTKCEFEDILFSYPMYADELSKNIIYQGEYFLVRYRIGETELYSPELNNELHKKEFCYNPSNNLPQSKFTEVFAALWQRFVNGNTSKFDYF